MLTRGQKISLGLIVGTLVIGVEIPNVINLYSKRPNKGRSIASLQCTSPTQTPKTTPSPTPYASTPFVSYDVITQHQDSARTGANLYETTLNTTNVNPSQFGLLFKLPVDGTVFAQPLYVSQVNLGVKAIHNVVIVATSHNSIYAFDADNGTELWSNNFGTSVPINIWPDYADDSQEYGIMSTPYIDLSTNTIFAVSHNQIPKGPKMFDQFSYRHRLHALDLTTGVEHSGSPVDIEGSVQGTGAASKNGMITLDHYMHIQRPALTWTAGRIVIGFGSHGDTNPYHGWIFSYDAASLTRLGVYNLSPNSAGASPWMSGQGFSVDNQGNVYGASGNGFNSNANLLSERPDTIFRLSIGAYGIDLLDYFTPSNWTALDNQDLDVGASGTLVIQDAGLVVGGSKTGTIYSLLMSNMGQISNNDSGAHQEFSATLNEIHGTPIYWNGPNGPTIYVWSGTDVIKAFQLSGNTFNTTPIMQGSIVNADIAPGATLTLSSNGTQSGSAIVWSNAYTDDETTGILRAFDATDLTHELWDTAMNPSRDAIGNFGKFVAPTVANGKVYMATFSNQVNVYGLLSISASH